MSTVSFEKISFLDRSNSEKEAEFRAIPNAALDQYTPANAIPEFKTGTLSENWGSKNRYFNIIANESTRVKLAGKKNDYINANYCLNGRVIISQGPMGVAEVGYDGHHTDFYHMLWTNDCSAVAMVTDYEEDKKPKCSYYLPIENEKKIAGEYTIEMQIDLSSENLHLRDLGIKVSRLYLKKAASEIKTVSHYHFPHWKDGECTTEKVVSALARTLLKEKTPVIHCSAGIGRSGTLVATMRAYELIQDGSQQRTLIRDVVTALRSERRGCVQTTAQYLAIYESVKTMFQEDFENEIRKNFRNSISSQDSQSSENPYRLSREYRQKNDPLNQSDLSAEELFSEFEEGEDNLSKVKVEKIKLANSSRSSSFLSQSQVNSTRSSIVNSQIASDNSIVLSNQNISNPLDSAPPLDQEYFLTTAQLLSTTDAKDPNLTDGLPTLEESLNISAQTQRTSMSSSNIEENVAKVTVHCKAPYPHNPYIRGQGNGLSWEKGIPLKRINDETFIYRFSTAERTEFKIYMNDVESEGNINHCIENTNKIKITPTFRALNAPTIAINCDLKEGQKLYIRGNGPGMGKSKDEAVELKKVNGTWIYESPQENFKSFEFKIYIDNELAEPGLGHTATQGAPNIFYAVF
jgi:protein tyrosine phosphatase